MKVLKRDGITLEDFNIDKIVNAVNAAFVELNQTPKGQEIADHLGEDYFKREEVTIEEIQRAVELALITLGYTDVAYAYMTYRIKRDVVRAEKEQNPWSDNDERQDLILQKYTIGDETKAQFIHRISLGNPKLAKIFRNKEGLWGGRNLYAIGREGNITGSNCYVATDPEDSLEDIYRADFHLARTYSYGGGQGLNISKLRPRGSLVNNSSNTSPGPMVFADKYSHTTLNTQQESRRGALMLVMNIDHPDIVDFATAKLDLSKINGANISLAMTDKFMEAVVSDGMWEMNFETPHQKITKRVKARDLLEVIAYSNHTMGDPGMLFIDKVNNYHFLSEYDEVKFSATNPCGEQPLMANGSCNLGSINLNAFVRDPFTPEASFDFDRFEEVTMEMTWGLDDLLTMLGDRHALPAQRLHVTQWREIGLGLMGLADLALSMGFAYGSDEFLALLEPIMQKMINAAVKASALRAKEQGAFPKFSYEKTSSSEFYKATITPETDELVRQYGMRNSRLLSIAPTGSISNVLGISGGVEPFFMLGYQRVIKSMFEEEKTITVWEKTPQALAEHLGANSIDNLPEWAKVTSQNIPFTRRGKVQSLIQKYVDTAISSTFNLNNEVTVHEIMDLYVEAWKLGLKGATVFRDNCAKVGILSGVGVEQMDKNPATPPTITLEETWVDKKTGVATDYVNHIHIEGSGTKSTKIERELCPLCGDVLVKQSGCTKCRNNECDYEKCDI
jgi:ribonucleoside-diphosphate reductase alpha chain